MSKNDSSKKSKNEELVNTPDKDEQGASQLILVELKKENEELKKLVEGWKKKCADLVNQAEITKKQTADIVKYSNKKLLEQLLFFLDNYKQAMKSNQGGEKDSKVKNFLEGFQMNLTELQNILAKQGLEAVKIVSKKDIFNADLHQVLEVEENNDHPEGTILDILREGYLLHGRILRPAMVKISKKKEKQQK